MDASTTAEVVGSTVLMVFWLILVFVVAYLAISKSQHSKGFQKIQFNLLGVATIIVFLGDLIHTIGFDITSITADYEGILPLSSWGAVKVHTLSLFIDGVAFIIYYAFWLFILVYRYQDGNFTSYNKVTLSLTLFSLLTALFSPFISIQGLDYIISIYSLHILSFIVFGLMVVGKLIFLSKQNKSKESIKKKEELLLNITGWGFIVSFLFFVLALVLLPLNAKYGLLMVPKTLAYMVSFIALAILCKKE
ncbi:MAG: hypothetical protein ACTSUR_04300 [Candidatus Heimdallarchaeaceae archaeon]